MQGSSTAHEVQWSRRWQLFSLLVGPIAYSTFFIVAYLLAEAACQTGILMAQVAGIPLALLLVVALGLGTTGLVVYSGLHAYRAWRAEGDRDLDTEGRDEFMALAAVILTALFALATVLTALSVLVREPCRWM